MALAAVALAVGVGAYLVTLQEPLENRVAHLRPGMTRDEAEKVLGAPPGTHYEFGYTEFLDPATAGPEWSHWYWDEGHVSVRFDGAGHVDQILFDPHPPVTPSDRLRWRLESWRWRLSR